MKYTTIRKRACPFPDSPPEKRKLRKCIQDNEKLRSRLSRLEAKHRLPTDYLRMSKGKLTDALSLIKSLEAMMKC